MKLGVDCPPTPSLRGCISNTTQNHATSDFKSQQKETLGREPVKTLPVGREDLKKKPITKPVWIQRSSLSSEDKTRAMTSETRTNTAFTIKLNNSFSALDEEESRG